MFVMETPNSQSSNMLESSNESITSVSKRINTISDIHEKEKEFIKIAKNCHQSTLSKQKLCGYALFELKQLHGSASWPDYCKETFKGAMRYAQAQNYIRLYMNFG